MTELALTRSQIAKLYELTQKVESTEWFTIKEDSSSGIGPSVTVHFDMFNDSDKDTDTVVNITDVSTW